MKCYLKILTVILLSGWVICAHAERIFVTKLTIKTCALTTDNIDDFKKCCLGYSDTEGKNFDTAENILVITKPGQYLFTYIDTLHVKIYYDEVA